MSKPFNFDDPVELDRHYDVGAAVSGIDEIAKVMMTDSAKVRLEHEGYVEFLYGPQPLQSLDYFPAEEGSPLLVYIHGGYWHLFDKMFFSVVGEAWNKVGVSVAVLNYRLAPDVTMTEIVDDVRQSIVWLWRNAEHLNFDTSRMVVSGSSAGGHLTAMMLATDWRLLGADLPTDMLKGGASISGLHDLEPFLRAPFLKDIIRLTDAEVERLSPARLKPASSAPLITCVGGDESSGFHAQNELIAERWPSVFRMDVASPGTNHITVNAEMTDSDSDLFKAVQGLFR